MSSQPTTNEALYDDWIITKYDDFGEPLLRERKQMPDMTPMQRYEVEMERYLEAMW